MKYNPGILSHEALEALFVGEERCILLENIVEDALNCSTSDQRNHRLLVGRRGAGKSHLVALAHHRIKQLADTKNVSLQLSWLPEDPLTIHSYAELLKQIIRRVDASRHESLQGHSEGALQELIESSTRIHGPVIVFAENVDHILEQLGNTGQQLLRHFLQTSDSVLLIASSTTMSNELTRTESPFYGFFTTTMLKPFDEYIASEQLAAIATKAGDLETANYVKTETGLSRLRAIQHLAGGQPRMWSTLGETLSPESLDQLVTKLLKTCDELTPYYQEQLSRLTPLQRRIVGVLATADRPMSVDEISAELESTNQTISKALNILHKEKRWVRPCQTILTAYLDKRRTYYELAESIAGLIFQIKDNRGEPLKLVFEFIRRWFEPKQIEASNEFDHALFERHIAASGETDPAASTVRDSRGSGSGNDQSKFIMFRTIDQALHALENDDASLIFALPSAVRLALERELMSDSEASEGKVSDAWIRRLRCALHQQAAT